MTDEYENILEGMYVAVDDRDIILDFDKDPQVLRDRVYKNWAEVNTKATKIRIFCLKNVVLRKKIKEYL